MSSESEWRQIKRDLDIAAKTGCKYHVCHVSTKESVEIIRNAKKTGIDVTCETAPHYLVFSDADLRDDGRFKMNPPLRSEEDRYALTEAIQDGTIDMIATDHAPHSAEEKSGGLRKSLNGIVGLETAIFASFKIASFSTFKFSKLSGTGFKFGIAQTAVYPPAAAARVALLIVSLYKKPGSLR